MKDRTFKIFVLALALLFIALFSAKAETTIMQMRNGDRYKVEVLSIAENRFSERTYMSIVSANKNTKHIGKFTMLSNVESTILFRILEEYQINDWYDLCFTYEAMQYPYDNCDTISVIGKRTSKTTSKVAVWRGL